MTEIEREARFTAAIYRVGILRCIDVPERVRRELGAKSKVSVRVTTRGGEFTTGLVPKKGGGLRLFVRMSILKALDKDAGSRLSLKIRIDPAARRLSVPQDLREAMEANENAGVRKLFDRMAPSFRRELVAWVSAAKRAETRSRRIERAVEMVIEKAARQEDRSGSRFL